MEQFGCPVGSKHKVISVNEIHVGIKCVCPDTYREGTKDGTLPNWGRFLFEVVNTMPRNYSGASCLN